MSVMPELLELLVCPACHGNLYSDDAHAALCCPACGLRYPVRDDIPILLPEQAEPFITPDTGTGDSGHSSAQNML